MNIALWITLTTLAPSLQRSPVPQPEAPAPEIDAERTFAVYDVHDLVAQGSQRVLDSFGEDLDPEEVRAARERRAVEDLIEMVSELIEPPLVPELEHVRVESLRGSERGGAALNLLARSRQHAWVQRFLDVQRRYDDRLVDLQAVLVSGPRGCFRDLGFERSSAVLETRAERKDLLDRIENETRLQVVTSPRLVAYNRQRASISVLNDVPYVKEYRLSIEQPGDVERADPVIDVVQEGCTIALRGVCVDEGLYALDVELNQAEVTRPMKTRKVRVSALSDAEVQVSTPEVATIAVESRVLLADGASVVFLAASPTKDQDLAVVLSLTTTTEDPIRAAARKAEADEAAAPVTERR